VKGDAYPKLTIGLQCSIVSRRLTVLASAIAIIAWHSALLSIYGQFTQEGASLSSCPGVYRDEETASTVRLVESSRDNENSHLCVTGISVPAVRNKEILLGNHQKAVFSLVWIPLR